MYTYIPICTCILYTHYKTPHARTQDTHIHMYIHTCVRTHGFAKAQIGEEYVHMCVHMYIHMYVHMYMCILCTYMSSHYKTPYTHIKIMSMVF